MVDNPRMKARKQLRIMVPSGVMGESGKRAGGIRTRGGTRITYVTAQLNHFHTNRYNEKRLIAVNRLK